MAPDPDKIRSSKDMVNRHLEWICRIYTDEVWADLHPSYRRMTPPNYDFMNQIEESHLAPGEDAREFRSSYAKTVKAYAWTGIKFAWNSHGVYAAMFEAHYRKCGFRPSMQATARLLDMRRLLFYMEDWVKDAAYFLWESEGKQPGRNQEYWDRATEKFLGEHSEWLLPFY